MREAPRLTSASPQVLRKINPLEANILRDPTLHARLRFRFGGESFPPIILYKIFINASVLYVSGATHILPGSEAAQDACDRMGDRRYFDLVLGDIERQLPIADERLVSKTLTQPQLHTHTHTLTHTLTYTHISLIPHFYGSTLLSQSTLILPTPTPLATARSPLLGSGHRGHGAHRARQGHHGQGGQGHQHLARAVHLRSPIHHQAPGGCGRGLRALSRVVA